jgi:putative FmdB family regulatory protein
MPVYEFDCGSCGERFDQLVKVGEAPPCPVCGTPQARRRWSPVSPPAKVGLRGRAARESDARRADREAARRERFAQSRRGRSG